MSSENQPEINKSENEEPNPDPNYTPQYPGYNYPRPSSVQPPSNYPYPPSSGPVPTPPAYPGYNPASAAPPYSGEYKATAQVESVQPQNRLTPLPLPTHRVVVTYAILALIVVMYLASVIVDGSSQGFSFTSQISGEALVQLGALYSPFIREQGEWWRLITVMFLHANLLHIGLNGFNLYVLGKQLEALFGPLRYTAIYFLGGLTGSILSFGLHSGNFLAVGASGAIFGLLGAMIGYFLRQRNQFGQFGRRYLQSLLTTAGLNFALLLLIPGVDNIAHFGGLIGGLVVGYLSSPLYNFSQTPDGRLQISQRDQTSYGWIIYSLVWLVIISLAFFFFLSR